MHLEKSVTKRRTNVGRNPRSSLRGRKRSYTESVTVDLGVVR